MPTCCATKHTHTHTHTQTKATCAETSALCGHQVRAVESVKCSVFSAQMLTKWTFLSFLVQPLCHSAFKAAWRRHSAAIQSGCWRAPSTKGLRVQSRRTTLQVSRRRHRRRLCGLSRGHLPSSVTFTVFRSLTSGETLMKRIFSMSRVLRVGLENHEEVPPVPEELQRFLWVVQSFSWFLRRFHWSLGCFYTLFLAKWRLV